MTISAIGFYFAKHTTTLNSKVLMTLSEGFLFTVFEQLGIRK